MPKQMCGIVLRGLTTYDLESEHSGAAGPAAVSSDRSDDHRDDRPLYQPKEPHHHAGHLSPQRDADCPEPAGGLADRRPAPMVLADHRGDLRLYRSPGIPDSVSLYHPAGKEASARLGAGYCKLGHLHDGLLFSPVLLD